MSQALDVRTDDQILLATAAASPYAPRAAGALDPAFRIFDIFVAAVAIVILAPVMVALAVLIRAADGGPALFAHDRVGLGGRAFRCIKFRTMVVDADVRLAQLLAEDPFARREWQSHYKLRSDPRISRLGGFLRRSSLDELPQLFNVLRGDMSIVGPRPIVISEIPLYGRRYRTLCSVRPGMTGLWQVSGRNDTTYRRRVALDTVYAKNKSLLWDMKIMAMTISAVIFARGSY